MKIISKLVNLEVAEREKEALQLEREKKLHFESLKKENIVLK